VTSFLFGSVRGYRRPWLRGDVKCIADDDLTESYPTINAAVAALGGAPGDR
jgi:hypothetical protein